MKSPRRGAAQNPRQAAARPPEPRAAEKHPGVGRPRASFNLQPGSDFLISSSRAKPSGRSLLLLPPPGQRQGGGVRAGVCWQIPQISACFHPVPAVRGAGLRPDPASAPASAPRLPYGAPKTDGRKRRRGGRLPRGAPGFPSSPQQGRMWPVGRLRWCMGGLSTPKPPPRPPSRCSQAGSGRWKAPRRREHHVGGEGPAWRGGSGGRAGRSRKGAGKGGDGVAERGPPL